MSHPDFIDRPPRLQPELPAGEYEIPKPPAHPDEGPSRLIQVALPLVTIIGYVLISTVGGSGRNPWLLVPMALSVVASGVFSIYSHRREQQRRAEAERAYADHLVELARDLRRYHDQQRRFYAYNYPDPDSFAPIVARTRAAALKAPEGLRAETRLWERRVADADFGVIRLGLGTIPSSVTYKLGALDSFETPLARSAMQLAASSFFVVDCPVVFSLRPQAGRDDDAKDEAAEELAELFHPPATHALAVTGQPAAVYALLRALLAHYVVFHAPSDARLYLLAGAKDPWTWAEPLPHCRPGEHGPCVFFLSEMKPQGQDAEPTDEEGDDLERYLEGLRRLLAQRKIRLQDRDDNEQRDDPRLPFCLVVVDLLDAVRDEGSRLYGIETDAALAILMEEGAALGASVLFLVPERSKVPGGCTAVIEVEATTPATNSPLTEQRRLHFRYAEVGVNSPRYVGVADQVATQETIAQLAQAVAGLSIRLSSSATLPAAVPFFELEGYGTLTELRLTAERRWQESALPTRSSWLRVPIGRMAGNKTRTLVFSAKRDGVHGVVAGSTGSGKSELLISLIAAMAVRYDPSVLNFVLVDYKGGGAFKEFARLPHCVDIITNLAADGVTRMFTAIQAEMRRRQKLNADTGTKNIVEYCQKGLHRSHAPYPFLFIIIDEFAEMIADRSEYKAQLESITRVGRAQGVSLILAAQRPSGVTDQMRANIKFRICLRVETPGESREMLRRTEAAYLPAGVPGRGYLQVGNEELELLQVAYTGDRYLDPARRQAPVIWPRRASYDATQDQEPPELYKAIIEALDDLAAARGTPKQRAPWPGFLPRQLALSQLLVSDDPGTRPITAGQYLFEVDRITMGRPRPPGLTLSPALNRWLAGERGWDDTLDWQRYAMRPVVGLIDNPYAARQLPLVAELPRGHMVVFGASGWGKTTFLRTLAVSLAAGHSPEQCHLYLLDLGGRSLGALEPLPHVGAFITPDEEGYKERVEQLLRELANLVEQRKGLLVNADAPDLYAYNQARPAEALPAVVLLLDNFVEFRETFGAQADNVESVLEQFIALARQCKPFGIHLVITAGHPGELPSQLNSLFTERLALKLSDPTDYRVVVGGGVDDVANIPGRGYVRGDEQPLSVQVATPIDLHREGGPPASEGEELRLLAQHMAAALGPRTDRLPIKVAALPRAVLLKQILARLHGLDLSGDITPALERQVRADWATSMDPAEANWLRVTLGVISGNRPRELKLEAKEDGVHGMIAGGTGSGKSELLMSLIVGLALRYDPGALNFVLVDYKGGGAFAPFKELPHCVDTISNLNRAAVRRVFTAIRAEMEHRQRLNTETGTKDIVEYRQKGFHLGHRPYPFLMIIIDEYAEMITDSPEFGEQLDSITRLGRAQGVHLVLASQRPTGVSDQMRANIKLRICLKVEGVDTSREMLRRADAAFLPNGMPGRGYLQVGNDQIELLQVAYTGEKYDFAPLTERGEPPRFYEVAVQLAGRLHAGERPRAPWPQPLPGAFTLGTPLLAEYLRTDQATAPLIQAPGGRPALNVAARAWLAGNGRWPGVDWQQTAMRVVVGLIDNPQGSCQHPLMLNLARGHAVIFGASGWGKTTFLRSLALSLAATHSPAEAHIHALDLGGRNLEVLEQLPQVGTVILPDERGYEERVRQLWRELDATIERRKRLFSGADVATLPEYNQGGKGPLEPAIVVLIDNLAEFIESFGGGTEEDNLLEQFIALARQGKPYGVHFVITIARPNALSSKLYNLFTERLTLRLADAGEYSAVVGSGAGEVEEIAGRGLVRSGRQPLTFQIALVPGAVDQHGGLRGEGQYIRQVGQLMREQLDPQAPPGARPFKIAALPTGVMYQELLARELGFAYDPATIFTRLDAAIAHEWAGQRAAANADWLKVTLGVASGDRPRTLKLEAKADGVHGMIAGGTGSGKSELLMTLIVGLAVRYPPDLLNFVLVDYKGGGAFRPFEALPHVVDIVTNLNKSAVHRMFTAIDAEIRRRQELNADTGTKDIVEYRQKGFHLSGEPYPHLFIIIDEYAEMISDNPEYGQQLDSITRVGRAQGVNLILASQRPRGVSDQMRANIKLRICLRVEQIDTSRELLRRPDAAFLPNGMPGRGFIQVGNEGVELVQVAYTGAKLRDLRPPPALWPGRVAPAAGGADEPPPFFESVVGLARARNGGRAAPRLWPGFLPELFSLETPVASADAPEPRPLVPEVTAWVNGDTRGLWPGVGPARLMQPAVLLMDEPDEARRRPFAPDLTRDHLAVFGDAGSGKTTLLRALVVALAATHSPEEFQAYVVDLGGRSFRSLERLPHVGAVIYADEETFEERLQRLIETLNRLADERQREISEANLSGLYAFNAAHPARAQAAVLVVIDNFAALQEGYESLVETALMPLARRAQSVGISFAVASNLPNHLPGRLYNLFTARLTFRQTDSDRYLDIVGRGAVELDDVAGRGYLRSDRKPRQFQAALAAGVFAEGTALDGEAAAIERMAEAMAAFPAPGGRAWRLPQKIEVLAPLIPLAAVQPPPAGPPVVAALGIDAGLRPALIDLRRFGPHFTILGPPLSGKTTALRAWLLSLALRYPPGRVKLALVDLQRRLFDYGEAQSLAALPHVVATLAEPDELKDFVGRLEQECRAMAATRGGHELYVFVDNFDEFSDEVESARLTRTLGGLMRRHGPDGLHLVIAAGAEGMPSELRKRAMASGFGLGLRTAQAVEALRVLRLPAGLRGRELPVGRGFLVRAGQATLLQVATPYEAEAAPGGQDELEQQAAALNAWVARIAAAYPGARAAWAGQAPAPSADGAAASNGTADRLIAALYALAQAELTRLPDGSGAALLAAKLLQAGPLSDPAAARALAYELMIQAKTAQTGVAREFVATLYPPTIDDDSLLFELRAALAAPEGN